jgi:phosphatidate cytidylyltransferase
MAYFSNIDSIVNPQILFVILLVFGLLVFATLLFYVLGKFYPGSEMDELKTRTKSWWVMSVIFFSATIININISYIALGFLSFLSFRELYSILNFRRADRRAIFWAFLSIPIQYALAYLGWHKAFTIFIPVVMFLTLPIRFLIKGEIEGVLKSMSMLQWVLMLSVYGLSHLAYLLSLPEVEGFDAGGRGLLLFVVCITEINDVLQFTFGKLIGKHKITPKVSPNKTWEGFVGGLISTMFIGYLLRFITPFSIPQVLIISFFIAAGGFLGDVVMSLLKRDIGVKDTGKTIPGHGGILDRVDSLTYTAPIFFHLTYFFIY